MTKVVILCGGLGTRIGHETKYKPKPMIKIGKKPIIWHLMKIYQSYGYNDFILSAGYKYKIIERYFRNSKEFNIKIVNTGLRTNTAGRISLLKKYIKENNSLMHFQRVSVKNRSFDVFKNQDSSLLNTLNLSDGILIRKPNAKSIKSGEKAEIMFFNDINNHQI